MNYLLKVGVIRFAVGGFMQEVDADFAILNITSCILLQFSILD